MKFHIFTLFPNVFESPLAEGVVGRALKSGLIEIKINNIRLLLLISSKYKNTGPFSTFLYFSNYTDLY